MLYSAACFYFTVCFKTYKFSLTRNSYTAVEKFWKSVARFTEREQTVSRGLGPCVCVHTLMYSGR